MNFKLQRAVLCSHAYPALSKWPFNLSSSFCFAGWFVPGDLSSPSTDNVLIILSSSNEKPKWGGGGGVDSNSAVYSLAVNILSLLFMSCIRWVPL